MTASQIPVPEPEDTVQVRRPSFMPTLMLVFGFVAGLVVGYLAWGQSPAAVAQTAAAPTAAAAAQRYDIPVGSAPTTGPANAPVTIIEFSDYECIFCQKWHTETWSQIQKAYPNQVRLVYKDFPVPSLHPNATQAAKAARCSFDQGKYWLFHDRLFTGKAFSLSFFELIAVELGLDAAKWRECVNSTKYDAEIQADYRYGAQMGITGTPTFFINGIPLVGAQPFSVFKQVIDQELAKK